jgi:hypothetical protein
MADQTYYKEISGIFLNATNSTIKECKNKLIDSIDGNLISAQKSIETNQFCFLYLYADWCARSLYYKELIENLTCLHSNEVSLENESIYFWS